MGRSLREKQAEIAKDTIVQAARRCFTQKGYVRASILDIAKEAGVAVQTIYTNVGGKPALLTALLEVMEQHTHQEEIQKLAAQSTDPREILRLTARLRRTLMDGAGDIVRLMMSQAAVDADVERAWRESQRRSRVGCEYIIARLAAIQALRAGLETKTAADVLFTLSGVSLWIRLVDECGWSAEQAEAWQANILIEALLKASPG